MKDDMESHFGTDLSKVRLHRDSRAADLARGIGAIAFTRQHDIFLGSDAPALESVRGQRLLAHELVHTIQSQNQPSSGRTRVSRVDEEAELQAAAIAATLRSGHSVAPGLIKPTLTGEPVLWRDTPPVPIRVGHAAEDFPGAGGISQIDDATTPDGEIHEEQRAWLTVHHHRELEISGPILHYERIVAVRSTYGRTAHLLMRGETDLPIDYRVSENPTEAEVRNALQSTRGVSEIYFLLDGKQAQGTEVVVTSTLDEATSQPRLAQRGQETIHFGLTREQQLRAVLRAVDEAKPLTVTIPKPAKAVERTTTKEEEATAQEEKATTEEAEFAKKTEDEKADDFWNQVEQGIKDEVASLVLAAIAGALLAVLALVAIFAEGALAVAAAAILAIAIVGGLGYLIYKMVSDLIDRIKQDDWGQAAVGLLKDLALVAAAILGAVAVVVAIVLGPGLAAGIGLAALGAVGVAVVLMLGLLLLQRNEAVKTKDLRTFKRKVGEAVKNATEGISTIINTIVTVIVGGIGRLSLGPKLPPAVGPAPEGGGQGLPPVEMPPEPRQAPAPAPVPAPAPPPVASTPPTAQEPSVPSPSAGAPPKAAQEPVPAKPITPPVLNPPAPAPQPLQPVQPAAPVPEAPLIDAPPGMAVDPRVSGSGGIEGIRAKITDRNESVVAIYGRIRPQIPRQGFEDAIPPARNIDALRGLHYDNAHLWGRQFGDEAGAGVMHAPAEFNEVQQRVLEAQIKGLQSGLKPGEELILRARATSFPRDQYGGACARRYEYDFAVRTQSGGVSDRTGVVFDLPAPGSGSRDASVHITPGGLPRWE
jgi:hypothetical protein